MKKVSVKKEILMIIMIVVAVLAISSQVFATSNSPVQIPVINTGANETSTTTTNETVTITPNPVTPNTNVTTNTTGSVYQNTNGTLPQTGDASDYAIFMLIVVAVVIAVYAYRKVGQYNI